MADMNLFRNQFTESSENGWKGKDFFFTLTTKSIFKNPPLVKTKNTQIS